MKHLVSVRFEQIKILSFEKLQYEILMARGYTLNYVTDSCLALILQGVLWTNLYTEAEPQ